MAKNGQLLEILEEVGLSPDEASVYLASLSLGPTTVLKVARATGIKRTTVYSVIDALKERGLMRVELHGLKQWYAAENPEKLFSLLQRRKDIFQSRLPEFFALYKLQGTESVLKYYTGIPAMQQAYMATLEEIRPHQAYLVIANQEKWHNLDDTFAIAYTEARAKLPIETRLLLQDSPTARMYEKLEKNYHQETKILPAGNPLNVDTVLLPEKLVIAELTPPYTTLVIENKSVVELHREMFEMLWRSLPDTRVEAND